MPEQKVHALLKSANDEINRYLDSALGKGRIDQQLYEEAQKVFVAAEQRVYEQAKALTQTAEKDARQAAQRDEARRELLQARLYLAGVVYEIGKTYAAGSKQYKAQLTDAAGKYHDLYEKYSRYTAGLYARMQEGRAYKELGETDRAVEILKEMLTIPGVGRKTANVVLGTAYGIPSGIVVDTHVQRVARRLDLTKETDPEKIEQDLMKIIPKNKWIAFSHEMILHGRALCVARKPRCAQCPLDPICYAPDKTT